MRAASIRSVPAWGRAGHESAEAEAVLAYDEEAAAGRCAAALANGKRCPNASLPGSRYCGLPAHQALEGKDTDQVEAGAPAEEQPSEAADATAEPPERGAEEVVEPVASGEADASEEEPPAGEDAEAATPDPESSAAASSVDERDIAKAFWNGADGGAGATGTPQEAPEHESGPAARQGGQPGDGAGGQQQRPTRPVPPRDGGAGGRRRRVVIDSQAS